jgi:carbonyl reductase 1
MRNVLVTGANRGIGLGLVKRLTAEIYPTRVIMACRSLDKGQKALEQLSKEHVVTKNIHPIELDLMNPKTFHEPVSFVKRRGIQIDVLVNNAAVNLLNDQRSQSAEKAEVTLTCNLFNQIELTNQLLDGLCIRPGGKIVNVSSMVGNFRPIRNQEVKNRLKTVDSIPELVKIGQEYIAALDAGQKWQSTNALVPEYAFGKLLFSIYTELLARDERVLDREIQVNSVCPGWVRTEMGGPTATLSVEDAAATILEVINQPMNITPETHGKLYSAKQYVFVR